MDNARYNTDLRVLITNPSDSQGTTLHQIIHLSKTRYEGYGILLAIGNEIPDSQLKSWTELFRKQDINAVHPIRIDSSNFKSADRVALEGARFIWIFDSPEILNPNQRTVLKRCFQKVTRKEGIIVTDSALQRIVDPMVR